MRDKIKELIKSGEHEELIVEALCACESICGDFTEEEIKRHTSSVRAAWRAGEKLKQALNPKPVDMSVFVDSPIDCVFFRGVNRDGDPINVRMGNLKSVSDTWRPYCRSEYPNGEYEYCKPRINYWFSVDLFASGCDCGKSIESLESAGFEVDANYFDGYMRSFKITGLRDGYIWPWECE